MGMNNFSTVYTRRFLKLDLNHSHNLHSTGWSKMQLALEASVLPWHCGDPLSYLRHCDNEWMIKNLGDTTIVGVMLSSIV